MLLFLRIWSESLQAQRPKHTKHVFSNISKALQHDGNPSSQHQVTAQLKTLQLAISTLPIQDLQMLTAQKVKNVSSNNREQTPYRVDVSSMRACYWGAHSKI